MSKSLVAFLSVAALCCVGIDYVQEARKAGLRPGDMTVAAYADTIRDRISETEREDAEKPAPVTFADNARALPAAPTGWQRRDWSVEDATLVGDGAKALTEALIEASGPDGVQVYERNGAMVALHLGSGGTPPRLAKGPVIAVMRSRFISSAVTWAAPCQRASPMSLPPPAPTTSTRGCWRRAYGAASVA